MSDLSAHVIELLAPLGQAVVRRMFGSHGVYCDGVFIAILHDDALWLKTDALTRERFLAAGGEPFRYPRQGRIAELGFHTPPAEALESPPEFLAWARLALEAALRAREPAPARKGKNKRAGKRVSKLGVERDEPRAGKPATVRATPKPPAGSPAGSRRSRAPRRSPGSR